MIALWSATSGTVPECADDGGDAGTVNLPATLDQLYAIQEPQQRAHLPEQCPLWRRDFNPLITFRGPIHMHQSPAGCLDPPHAQHSECCHRRTSAAISFVPKPIYRRLGNKHIRRRGKLSRTRDLDKVINDFQTTMEDATERFLLLHDVVIGSGEERSLRKGISTDLAFRLGCEWELFQHRWHLAAISRMPATFVALKQAELDGALKKSNARHLIEAVSPGATSLPKRVTVEQIDALIDPDGYNVTFKDSESWAAESGQHLDKCYADLVRNIVGEPEDECVLTVIRAVRNVIAHQSSGSRAFLNNCIGARQGAKGLGIVGAKNQGLQRDRTTEVKDVATYLLATRPGGKRKRVLILVDRAIEISERLRFQPSA